MKICMQGNRSSRYIWLIFLFILALAGSITGLFMARILMNPFSEAPPWLLPAIVLGSVALTLVVVLTLPAVIRSRRQVKTPEAG